MDSFKNAFIQQAAEDLGTKKEMVVKSTPKEISGEVIERVEVPDNPVVSNSDRDSLLNDFAESMFKGKKVGVQIVGEHRSEKKVPVVAKENPTVTEDIKQAALDESEKAVDRIIRSMR